MEKRQSLGDSDGKDGMRKDAKQGALSAEGTKPKVAIPIGKKSLSA